MISNVRYTRAAAPLFNTTAQPTGTTGTPTATSPTSAGPTAPAGAAQPPVGSAEPSQPRGTLPTNKQMMGRDEFLRLFVAQLKNQDPINPMDGKDLSAQLAQFSTVEQLISMNKTLETQAKADEELKAALEALGAAEAERAEELAQLIEGQMATGMVGKVGVTNGNMAFVDKDGRGTIMIDAQGKTGLGRVTVTNAKGETVGTVPLGKVTGGQQAFDLGDFTWDPKLEPGQYSYKVEVSSNDGPYTAVKTYSAGRITGMKYDRGTPVLLLGDTLQVPLSQLIQLRN
jgi:flagellar basal-body rod modification protein FlgD